MSTGTPVRPNFASPSGFVVNETPRPELHIQYWVDLKVDTGTRIKREGISWLYTAIVDRAVIVTHVVDEYRLPAIT